MHKKIMFSLEETADGALFDAARSRADWDPTPHYSGGMDEAFSERRRKKREQNSFFKGLLRRNGRFRSHKEAGGGHKFIRPGNTGRRNNGRDAGGDGGGSGKAAGAAFPGGGQWRGIAAELTFRWDDVLYGL
jgi:hypothetical protein